MGRGPEPALADETPLAQIVSGIVQPKATPGGSQSRVTHAGSKGMMPLVSAKCAELARAVRS